MSRLIELKLREGDWIRIELSEPDADGKVGGAVASSLTQPADDGEPDDEDLAAALDAIETLVLAHACAGVDVESYEYLQGLDDALQSIVNHYG